MARPAPHDYTAAASYLSLLLDAPSVTAVVRRLRTAPRVLHPAKDLLRASGLPMLAVDDPEVAKDLKKVRKGTPLSPVLLVRGGLELDRALIVADGYHRICISYHIGDDQPVPCHIADLPSHQPAVAGARRTA